MSKDSALSRALARVDELEAENATYREVIIEFIAAHESPTAWDANPMYHKAVDKARIMLAKVEVQDERFCWACGCNGDVHHSSCKS